MKQKAIIHISDLHVTRTILPDGKNNEHVESYLTTTTEQDNSIAYIDSFIEYIIKKYENTDYVLLITGDISNGGDKFEFEYAKKFINRIIQKLHIQNDNCLIIPGDHDIHRLSLLMELDSRPNSESHLLNDIKFKNFGQFYSEIKSKPFPFNKIIIDYVDLGEGTVLISANSNYKIDANGGNGFIPREDFNTEFEDLKKTLGKRLIHPIIAWHHNITASHTNENSGQWEVENRKNLLPVLQQLGIKLILTGNEHTNSTKGVLDILTSDSGTFANKLYDASFKMYPITLTARKIELKNDIVALQRTGANDFNYFWMKRECADAKQKESFIIYEQNDQKINEIQTLPEVNQIEEEQKSTEQPKEERIFYSNELIAQKLYNIIRKKRLFHSGHFHWSETSRAHNWIDVSKLLENYDDLNFVQNSIIDVIETFALQTKCDLIIGLGYEGNIISSKASIKFNIPYTSLPYSYRYNDHHEFEKKLNFTNEEKKYNTVMIITDVVNDGRTIRKLIGKREKDFFKNVEHVIVVSLFYTGDKQISTTILNSNSFNEKYDFENDNEVNNIEFYTIKTLRVERCPYGSNYKTDCFIYKDELSCVHLFYDEHLRND